MSITISTDVHYYNKDALWVLHIDDLGYDQYFIYNTASRIFIGSLRTPIFNRYWFFLMVEL